MIVNFFHLDTILKLLNQKTTLINLILLQIATQVFTKQHLTSISYLSETLNQTLPKIIQLRTTQSHSIATSDLVLILPNKLPHIITKIFPRTVLSIVLFFLLAV